MYIRIYGTYIPKYKCIIMRINRKKMKEHTDKCISAVDI